MTFLTHKILNCATENIFPRILSENKNGQQNYKISKIKKGKLSLFPKL